MHDVIVVGAGPVGATLALALAGSGLDVLALDERAEGAIGRTDRSLALSHGSRLVYERLGVWSDVAATPDAVTRITAVDVSQRGGFGSVRLLSADEGLPALGYVVSYRALQAALDNALRVAGVPVQHGAHARKVSGAATQVSVETEEGAKDLERHARLAVVADGGGDLVPASARIRHDYHQTAVVAKVWTREPHAGVAFERFTSEGPMALLPQGDHYGLVWTARPAEADALLALAEEEFLVALQHRFGKRVSGFERVAERRAFPLRLEFARDIARDHVVLIGNAAQALHPVAGQGFNLGVRDAYELAQELLRAPRAQLGERSQLARYKRSRRLDRSAGIAFTHALLGTFGNEFAFLRWPRGLALTLLDAAPPIKRMLTHSMLFGWR